MSNRFYFTNSDDSTSNLSDPDPDNDSSLPFPKPIDRSSFLSPEFDPTTFLSSLTSRFQTLEDLQNELRELSQSLSKELVDLVNDNYQEFLNLGSTLSGGEERIEEIRVGLLGFQRDVGGVREKIDTRRKEIEDFLGEKKVLRREIARGRILLETAERIDELEVKLGLASKTSTVNSNAKKFTEDEEVWSDDWNESSLDVSDDDDYDEELGISTKLKDAVERYRILRLLMKKHDPQHPFLVSQRARIVKIQDTIRLDLDTASKREGEAKAKQMIVLLRMSMDD